jgi:hypothetical protein
MIEKSENFNLHSNLLLSTDPAHGIPTPGELKVTGGREFVAGKSRLFVLNAEIHAQLAGLLRNGLHVVAFCR